MPIVSVVMPVLATPEPLLRQAIQSILDQTLSDWELIIVEDPSDFVCTEVIRSFSDDRIRYVINDQRTGLVRQRNLGLEMAQGQFIAKADSDDISEPQRLQEQFDHLTQNEHIGVVGSHLTIVDSEGQRIGRREYPTDPRDVRRLMRRRNVIAQPAAFFRAELVRRFGGYPDGYPVCQDYAYWSHLAKQGVQLANLQQYLVRYRQHAASIKSTRLRETLDATLRVKDTYWRDEMTLADHGRMLGERLLRHAPASWTQRLFAWMTFRR
ncbi:glycosyltransferase [Stieleria varia]|uniref:Putative glycosyltransferase EpsE n=1 Tax=Stieleria varia TaxID=2528005 RepID=A0A5C6B957_9BACT|nr:glycosyltransferase [Stieleria varia]TWU07971.1 putative glycosyltransferase EpsE [Stieleria varia]